MITNNTYMEAQGQPGKIDSQSFSFDTSQYNTNLADTTNAQVLGTNIFVNYIPHEYSDEDLKKLFSNLGEVLTASFPLSVRIFIPINYAYFSVFFGLYSISRLYQPK